MMLPLSRCGECYQESVADQSCFDRAAKATPPARTQCADSFSPLQSHEGHKGLIRSAKGVPSGPEDTRRIELLSLSTKYYTRSLGGGDGRAIAAHGRPNVLSYPLTPGSAHSCYNEL